MVGSRCISDETLRRIQSTPSLLIGLVYDEGMPLSG